MSIKLFQPLLNELKEENKFLHVGNKTLNQLRPSNGTKFSKVFKTINSKL